MQLLAAEANKVVILRRDLTAGAREVKSEDGHVATQIFHPENQFPPESPVLRAISPNRNPEEPVQTYDRRN